MTTPLTAAERHRVGQTRFDCALPIALELVDAVHRQKARDVARLLDLADKDAVLVALAGMVDEDRPLSDLLGWVPTPGRRRRGQLATCGSHAAFNRHIARGEPVDPLCEAGERRYQRERARRRRAAARVLPLDRERRSA